MVWENQNATLPPNDIALDYKAINADQNLRLGFIYDGGIYRNRDKVFFFLQ